MNDALIIHLKPACLAVFVTAFTLPFWRVVCRKGGLVDAPGARKIHDAPMPLAGGLAIFTGIVLTVAWGFGSNGAGHPSEEGSTRLLALAGGAVAMLALGLLDDRFELRAGVKFTGQLLVASAACFAGLRLRIFDPGIDHLASVLWILTVTNAFNFMDNMNGLCAGLAAIGALSTGVVLETRGDSFGTLLCLATASAALGFLPFNYPRASAFLGDSGSHLLGFLMAALPLSAGMSGPAWPAGAIPILLVAVPLLDLIQVVVVRCWLRQPVWIGDRNHLSHRLVSLGLRPPVAVAVLWVVAIALALVAILTSRRG